MTTTTLFVEILIVGIQASAWLLMLILTIFGYHWINAATIFLKDWSALLTIILLAIFYSIGIVADRIFDALSKILHPVRHILKISWVQKKSEFLHKDNRMKVLANINAISSYHNYLLSRIRIAKATFFNTIFLVLTSLLFLLIQIESKDIKLIIIIISFGLFLILSSLASYTILEGTYNIRMKQLEKSLTE